MKNKFISGFGCIVSSYLDIINPKVINSDNGYKKDKELLKNDWEMVGRSLRGGINEFKSSKENYGTKK